MICCTNKRILIFVLFVSTAVSFDSAFSLWASLTWNYPMKHFPLCNRCYNHCKNVFYLFSFIAAVVRETYPFIKIMQPINPYYNWENRVKQIKITEENLSQSCILCQLLRTKTLASGTKCIKHFFYFYHYLPYICSVDVIY